MVELEALVVPAIVATVAEGGLVVVATAAVEGVLAFDEVLVVGVVVATAAVVGVLAFDEVLVVGAAVPATVPLETTPQMVQFLT